MSEVPLYMAATVLESTQDSLASSYLVRPFNYRGTSLIRNTPLVGPYTRPVPRDL